MFNEVQPDVVGASWTFFYLFFNGKKIGVEKGVGLKNGTSGCARLSQLSWFILFVTFFTLAGNCFGTSYDVPLNTTNTTGIRLDDNDSLTVEGTITAYFVNAGIDNTDGPYADPLYGASNNVITIYNTGIVDGSLYQTGVIDVSYSTSLTLNNHGSISGYSEIPAIYALAARDPIINNTGSILSYQGLNADSTIGAVIDNSGSITGSVLSAVYLVAEQFTLTNTGSISSGQTAIQLQNAENGVLHNSGTINTVSSNYAIDSQFSSHITIENAGTIANASWTAISGFSSHYLTIINSGNITDVGGNTIYAFGANNVSITNLAGGTIHSEANTALNLGSANSVSILNAGTISSVGFNAIWVGDTTSAYVNNSGLVISSGNSTALSGGASTNLTVFNSGTMLANDFTVVLDNGSTLTNSGSIIALEASYYDTPIAIYAANDSVTVIIEEGSTVTGTIMADPEASNANLILHVAPGDEAAYTYSGPWSVTYLYSSPQSFGTQETADKILFQRVSRINDSLLPRLSFPLGDYRTWIVPYGGYVTRDADATMPIAEPFRLKDGGVTIGTSLPIKNLLVDAIFNFNANHLNINDSEHLINAYSALAGILIPKLHGFENDGILSGKVLVGLTNHFENSGSSRTHFLSKMFLVGLEANWREYLQRDTMVKLSLGLDVAAEHHPGYQASNAIHWSKRRLTQLSGYIELTSIYPIDPNERVVYWGSVRASDQILLGGRTYRYLISGAYREYNQGYYDDIHTRGQIGIHVKLFSGVRMTASLDYSKSRHHLKKYQGYFGFDFAD